MDKPSLEVARAAYARKIFDRFGVDNPALLGAFAKVPRERFVGPGPWRILDASGRRASASDDPRLVYADVLIALDEKRGINNGEPSAHAEWINALGPKAGERINHIGAGTGYYSAILAEMVGPEGSVEAFELDPALAARARKTLADWPNVAVRERSGAVAPLPEADAIYVSAGSSLPLAAWLDALLPGGRLLFPLTDAFGSGAMLLITRGEGRWPARFVSGAAFIGLVGGGDAASEAAVAAAFRSGDASAVRWLMRDGARGRQDWLRGDGWRLTKDPL